ncbi:MAG: hypothetical protein HGA44_10725 [Cellulomonadaceae bacterium]|nr:hypothetical protein [Cellulomonadaceae bacterium]
MAFWRTVTATTSSPPRGPEGQFATLVPADGDAFMRVQRSDAPARVHLDLHVGDVDAELQRAVALGARLLHRESHAVLVSPGGFTFCLVADRGERERPAPVVTPDGSASLVDQLCLDIPGNLHGTEQAFWTALTGWTHRATSTPGLSVLDRPEGLPLRLLLQQLGGDDEGTAVRAHLDLACGAAVDALVAAHTVLGARVVRVMPGWTTLTDPAGLAYCLTGRDPVTGLAPA